MAKPTLEPDSPPRGPGSQGPGTDPETFHLGRVSPRSGQAPLDQSLQLMRFSRDVDRRKLEPAPRQEPG